MEGDLERLDSLMGCSDDWVEREDEYSLFVSAMMMDAKMDE